MIHRRNALLLSCLFLSAGATAAKLDVTLKDVANNQGHVLVALYDSEDAWEGRAKNLAGQRIVAAAGTLDLHFADLAPGRYGLMVMHDENDNGKLDSNLLGIPQEGYGFSNNPSLMRRANFDEVVFEVPETGHSVVVEMR